MNNAKFNEAVSIIGLKNFPLVDEGDDLAEMIVDAARRNMVLLDNGDIVVIAQKVVSKVEGRVIRLGDVIPSEQAKRASMVASEGLRTDPRFVELVLREAKEVLKLTHETLIVETGKGLVCVNAGIDKSNVSGKDSYSLLPKNPDRSARRIRSKIIKLTGKRVSVIISDTYSRPFRKGHVEFAIGIAGINPFKSYQGEEDLFNQTLKSKNVALVDEIASAAELIMGQGKEGLPVAIIKNLKRARPAENSSIEDLNISRQEDLYRDVYSGVSEIL